MFKTKRRLFKKLSMREQRIFYFALPIIVLLIVFFIFNLNSQDQEGKLFDSTTPITIKYQVDANYPPFSYVHENDLVGFDFYLTNIIFPSNHFILDYSTDEWDAIYQRIITGQIDIAGIVAVNEERKNDVLFTKTLFRSFVSVFTRFDTDIEGISTLGNYRIGVGEGYYTESLLRDDLKLDYIAYDDLNQALLDLKNGRIDALFENEQLIKTLLTKQELTGTIVERITDLYPSDHAYAISKSKPELVAYMNERIDSIKHSGVFEEIYMSYFYEHSDTYINERNRTIVLWVWRSSLVQLLYFYPYNTSSESSKKV